MTAVFLFGCILLGLLIVLLVLSGEMDPIAAGLLALAFLGLVAGVVQAEDLPPSPASTAITSPLELELYRGMIRNEAKAAIALADLKACRTSLDVRTSTAIAATVRPPPPAPAEELGASWWLVAGLVASIVVAGVGGSAVGFVIGEHAPAR